jgi:hypothetical protein
MAPAAKQAKHYAGPFSPLLPFPNGDGVRPE